MKILEFLDLISGYVEPLINVVTEDRDADFGGTLYDYCGVIGEHANDAVKKGVYLFADAYGDDERLMKAATQVYDQENGTKILYFNVVEKRKISGIHIYSLTGGGYAIEAVVEGIKAGPKKLSQEDALSLTDKTDRVKLAEKYLTVDGFR